MIFGKPLDEISDEPGSSPLGSGEYSERFWGKKANHGLNYALGPNQFALLYQLSVAEARMIILRYMNAYPGVKQYHLWVQAALRQNRRLTNPFGRTRIFLDRWGDDLFREGYAQIPQSTVPDIINERGLNFIHENQEWFDEVELLNQVHDSIVLQIPLTESWKYHVASLELLVENLERPIQWKSKEFSIPAEVSMGFNCKDLTDVKALTPESLEDTYEELLRAQTV